MKKVRNAISYVMLLAVFGGVFVIFPNYLSGVMLVFWLGVGIYDMISLQFLGRKLVVHLRLPKASMLKNSKVGIVVEVKNPTVFYSTNVTLKVVLCNEFYGEKTEVCFHIPVHGQQKGKVCFPIEFQNCGKVRVVLEEVRILGILGIAEWRQRQKRTKEDIFYSCPTQMDWQKKLKKQEGAGARILQKNHQESMQKGNNFVEVSDIREYIPGDRMRDIHWKLSAKKEVLMVKEHRNLSDTRQIVLLELFDVKSEQDHDTMEEVLELAVGVMRSFLAQGMGFELFWWNQKTSKICHKEVQGETDISSAMELVLEAEVYEDNLLLENLWRSQTLGREGYVWIGKDENTLKYKVIAKGFRGVVAKWEEG